MALYSVNKKGTGSHALLIGTPLVLITLFCFGYMAVQSHSDQHYQAASNKTVAPKTQPVSNLPPAQFSPAAGLSPVSTSNTTSGADSASAQTSAADTSSPPVGASSQKPAISGTSTTAAGPSKAKSTNLITVINKIL